MVYLRDSERAGRLLTLDAQGIDTLTALGSRISGWMRASRIAGEFGHIEGKAAALYAAGGSLWFAIDDETWLLDEIKIGRNGTSGLTISTPNRTYRADPVTQNPSPLDTPFGEAEDWSFGLWVAAIAGSPDRRKVLLDTLYDAPLDEVPDRDKASVKLPAKSWKQGAHREGHEGQGRNHSLE